MTIKLNDGTEYDVGWCGASRGVLSMDLIGEHDFLELARTFTNARKTERIECHYGEMCTLYEGFTRLLEITVGGWAEGNVLVCLKEEGD